MRMLRPFRRSAVRRHASARLAPSQTAAASSKVMPVGLCASGALSRTQTNSACAPKPMTPKTSSPTSNSLTAAPTASTSPASPLPRVPAPPGRAKHGGRLEHERPRVSGDIDPASLQRASSPEERILADGVDDRVVGLAVLREVLLEVVDDLVGAG